MDWLNGLGLNPELQFLATAAFVIGLGIFAAWGRTVGKREPVKPEVREFGFAGQLADMGPVKELIANTGLLTIQQNRTAVALERLAAAYEGQIAREKSEDEIEEEVQRRFDRELARERRSRRRATTPRKKPATAQDQK